MNKEMKGDKPMAKNVGNVVTQKGTGTLFGGIIRSQLGRTWGGQKANRSLGDHLRNHALGTTHAV